MFGQPNNLHLDGSGCWNDIRTQWRYKLSDGVSDKQVLQGRKGEVESVVKERMQNSELK